LKTLQQNRKEGSAVSSIAFACGVSEDGTSKYSFVPLDALEEIFAQAEK